MWRRVWWTLGPAAVVAALAALAAFALKADNKTGWTVGSGVLAAVAGAFSPSVVQWLQGLRRAREARRRALAGGLVVPLPASVVWLLHPDQAVVSFFGREWTLQQLHLWCEDPGAGAVRLVTAAGGVGKSRLASHLAAESPGWECWRVAVGAENPIVDALHGDDAPGRVLLLVDYAEARPPAQLAALLCAAAGADGRGGHRVRVLLLARTAGTWWTSLSAAYPQQAALVDSLTMPASHVIKLEVHADARDAQEIVTDAAAQFAARLHYAVPQVPPRPRDPHVPLLRLHAEALVAVLGGARSGDGRYDVLAELLGHETRYWRYCAQQAGLIEAGDDQQRRLVATAALFGAADDEQDAGLITRVPGLTEAPAEQVARWVRWLRGLYPAEAGRLGTLQPDLLAEHLAVDVLCDYPAAQCATAFTGLTAVQAVQALRVLGRASAHRSEAGQLIDIALAADLPTMAEAVLEVATQFPGLYAPRLAALLPDAEIDTAALVRLAGRVPHPSRELNPVALACTTRLVTENGVAASDRASRLSDHVVRLSEAGRPLEALAASTESVTLYRELAAADRAAYLPKLALAVNNRAVQLARVGRHSEALTATDEAVTLRRELAATNPGAHLRSFATSVNNHAIQLAAAGRLPEALTTSEEAVTLHRELAAANRDAHLPDLAMAVHNHALRLAEAGRLRETLTTSEEAVTLHRELAAANRDAYLPKLATSVNNHAVQLVKAGRLSEALTTSAEAVTLRRELTATHRDAYLPDLALSLDNHALWLARAGRHGEALATSGEAVALYRELAAANHGA